MASTQTKTRDQVDITYPKKYNVVIHNDDVTPMDFVISLLVEVFHRNLDQATDITLTIHEKGRGIAGTYSHEVAEQKQRESTLLSHRHGHPLAITLEEADK